MPSEDMLQKLEGNALVVELKSYEKTFESLFRQKKYMEAYNLTIAMAVKERGSTIDAKSIQNGMDMLSLAMTEGDEKVYRVFFEDFSMGLVDSDAPMTSGAMVQALEASQKKGGGTVLAVVGIGFIAMYLLSRK